MLLTIKPDHEEHILLLTQLPCRVLQDFCKMAIGYLQRGPHIKLYNAAAQKLEVEVNVIKNAVQGLVNLLLESCRYKLSSEDFRDSVLALGFSEDQEIILSKLYNAKKDEILDTLKNIGFKLPKYHDMEWRFEVQIASRSLLKQLVPLITLDFSIKNPDKDESIEHTLLQTDPVNLLHITQELEEALREGRSQHIRRLSRVIK